MLSAGMSYDLFWYGDTDAAQNYIDKIEIERKNKMRDINFKSHLQGQYIYDALCCAAPLFNAFTKKGTKLTPYPKEPYKLHVKEESEKEKISPELESEKRNLWTYYQMKMLEAGINTKEVTENS